MPAKPRPTGGSIAGLVIALLTLAAALLVGILVLLDARPQPVQIQIIPAATNVVPADSLKSPTVSVISVYVVGAVNQPFTVVRVPHGSRIADVIHASGGAAQDADLARINLAQTVQDGDQVDVPRLPPPALLPMADSAISTAPRVEAAPILSPTAALPTISPPSTTQTAAQIGRINVNTASAAELELLPGIGPVLAARIVAYREANGRFADLIALDAVSGIGRATLAQIAPYVVFE